MSRRPYRRQYRQAAIARGYARQWRPGEPSDLSVFVGEINQHLSGTAVTDWPVKVNERRGTVTLTAPRGDYRATLRPGALVASGETWQPITAADVVEFEFRRGSA